METGATGVLRGPSSSSPRLSLKGGQVCDVVGLPGLLSGLGEDDVHSLQEALPRVMASGHQLQDVLEAACEPTAAWLAGLAMERRQAASFSPEPVNGLVELPEGLLRLMERGLRSTWSMGRHEAWLKANRAIEVRASHSPPLGLAPSSLAILREARTGPTLEGLVGAVVKGNPARRADVFQRILLLRTLGLLELASREQRPAAMSPEMAAELERFKSTGQELASKGAYSRLSLDHLQMPASPTQADQAFRRVSPEYHPDRFHQAPPALREAARECFALLGEARDALDDPATAKVEWDRLLCERDGRPYVTQQVQNRAAIAFKKGEALLRSRDYTIAEACFAEAAKLDPGAPHFLAMHMYTAFLARQIGAEEAARRIEELKVRSPVEAARFLFLSGKVLQLHDRGDVEHWLTRFQRGAILDPENRDIQREIRLHERRTQARAAGRPSSRSG